MLMNTTEYKTTLSGIMEKIKSAQVRAARAVNRELVVLYWSIGTIINRTQRMG